jgi:hypothetical protein
MKYKNDFEILANCKRYTLFSLHDDGSLNELEHEFEGDDIVGYTFKNEKLDIIDGDYGDFNTILECKNFIDEEFKDDD